MLSLLNIWFIRVFKENYIPNLDKTENIIVENKVQNQKSVNKTGYQR